MAAKRGQTLAEMALSWVIKDPRITSVLLGVSKPEQITDSIKCIDNYKFSEDELNQIQEILK